MSAAKQSQKRRNVFWETRTRILAWYALLMAFFMGVSLPAIRQALYSRVEERVNRSLIQEVEEFRRLQSGRAATGRPFRDVKALFDVYLSRNIPGDDEFFVTLLDGELYQCSPRAVPSFLQPNSILVRRWATVIRPERSELSTSVGKIFYLAEPVLIQGELRGVFVVAHITAGERQEVDDAIRVILKVMLAVLGVASLLAWIVTGRILAPLRSLTLTARSISESELSQRIAVMGSGEIAELATTFNQMMDRLQVAFASQQDFVNDAGHELRTPITIIRGHLELMGNDPEEQRETLVLVLDELDRMNRFVDDLLLLAKAERPDFLNLERVDIGLLTEEMYAKVKALADRTWKMDARATGYVLADRQRLTQAVMNLAQNATQHTATSDAIAIGSAIEKGYARFWVRDTGDGIALADQQRIFERFARVPKSRRRSEGAGLGLAIVRAIAEAHQGQVDLSSQVGAGATFTIVVPLNPLRGATHL